MLTNEQLIGWVRTGQVTNIYHALPTGVDTKRIHLFGLFLIARPAGEKPVSLWKSSFFISRSQQQFPTKELLFSLLYMRREVERTSYIRPDRLFADHDHRKLVSLVTCCLRTANKIVYRVPWVYPPKMITPIPRSNSLLSLFLLFVEHALLWSADQKTVPACKCGSDMVEYCDTFFALYHLELWS